MKTNVPDTYIRPLYCVSLAKRLPGIDLNSLPVWARAVRKAAVGALLLLLLAAPLAAAPVTRDEAFRAAARELPGFFAGPWCTAGELAMHSLTGDTVAYVFMFSNLPKPADSASTETPAAFVARQRARLAAGGSPVSGAASELYGEDRFASIYISASDTEPVVLRCFKGLPPQVVREADALALGAKSRGGAWRVRQCLMLGLFDEAFLVEPATGTGDALVVDLRTRGVATEQDAQTRAQAKQAPAADPERIRLCQAAWTRYRGDAQSGSPGPQTAPVTNGRTKKVVIGVGPNQKPLSPAPQDK